MPQPFLDELEAALQQGRQIREAGPAAGAPRRLRSLTEEVRAALSRAALGGAEATTVDEALGRLAQVVTAYDAAGMERLAAETYAEPRALRDDVDLILALAAAPEEAQRLLTMQIYVRRASVPEAAADVELGELAVDRRLVLERLSMTVPLQAPHQMDDLAATVAVFRRRYESTYLDQHRRYSAEVRSLRARLDEHDPYQRALTLLNEIREIGPAVGAYLREGGDELREALTTCYRSQADLEAALRTEPVCLVCELKLGDSPPSEAVFSWLEACRAALRTKQRRLASAMVARAAGEQDRPAFDRFLSAVRASDVGPLVEMMDETVAALIRELLADDAGQ